MVTWNDAEAGLVTLSDGRRMVGRGVRDEGDEPQFALIATGLVPRSRPYDTTWIPWPDYGLPVRQSAATRAIRIAYERAAGERVAVMCGHGSGRTGAILAVLAVLGGVAPEKAVTWIRAAYRAHAVETPWQRRWVRSTGRALVS